jgi:hypothetical protein
LKFDFSIGIFSDGTGTNTATAVSLYVYFLPTLMQNEIANDFIGTQFRAGLVSVTKGGVRKLKLRDKYVLARDNQPTPAANVGRFFRKTAFI